MAPPFPAARSMPCKPSVRDWATQCPPPSHPLFLTSQTALQVSILPIRKQEANQPFRHTLSPRAPAAPSGLAGSSSRSSIHRPPPAKDLPTSRTARLASVGAKPTDGSQTSATRSFYSFLHPPQMIWCHRITHRALDPAPHPTQRTEWLGSPVPPPLQEYPLLQVGAMVPSLPQEVLDIFRASPCKRSTRSCTSS